MSESSDWNVPGSSYEIYENIFIPAMMGDWPPRLVALTKPQPGEHILDVACGTGVVTRFAAKLVGPDGRVVGLDLSPEMLKIARMIKPDGQQLPVIEWDEGDVNALPYENETFDIVCCAFGFMFFPDRIAALKEIRRVLKPGGRMALSVWGSISKCPGQLAMKESWEKYIGTDTAARILRQHVLSDPETVQSLVQDAGFRNVSVQPTMGDVHMSSPEQLVRSYCAMAGISADDETKAEVIGYVISALQPYITPEGLVYPIEAILASAIR